jgi:hypothetical protein
MLNIHKFYLTVLIRNLECIYTESTRNLKPRAVFISSQVTSVDGRCVDLLAFLHWNSPSFVLLSRDWNKWFHYWEHTIMYPFNARQESEKYTGLYTSTLTVTFTWSTLLSWETHLKIGWKPQRKKREQVVYWGASDNLRSSLVSQELIVQLNSSRPQRNIGVHVPS